MVITSFAWVDHLRIPAPPRVDIPCSDLLLLGLDDIRSSKPTALLCSRPKNHGGRHHESHFGIIQGSWKKEEK